MPARGGRTSSNPWGRLKAPDQDPLESMGLPSKGDTRLLDFKTQERYYTKIVERYMSFCSDSGQRDELLRRFASLNLDDAPLSGATAPAGRSPAPTTSNTKALSDVMMALRKLREGIVASSRADDFAVQSYLFCIRLSVLVKHPESYHPAILHLLRNIHPMHSLTSLEFQEVVGYLVLDAACRRGDLAEAFNLWQQHGLRDSKVYALLKALTHDNYVAFGRIKGAVDAHKASLMELAERDLRVHTLKCFGRSYLSVDRAFLEKATASGWERLTKEDGVGWHLDGDKVIIRKIKAR
ncbi:Uncharacterized protein SAPIO_CDS0142 [Scedosporium apiospermum]|uniref:CSN8/PSMD8/EIF3K domain-containing protein n=1 Tax=Pseudallescheria apiosperma TaxID=563466 RepID=A0A084GHL9_PSEDA|nr:Uncharacterized protein SAPIO_CDS0142 [Scedosporium apiospermum]KEZ46831.1 Uncharacterized protein SAPIO_CDS0142 [Scedosporium apiospermum]